jgi:hypothetical protein
MANGQNLAEENVPMFTTWAASKTDDDYLAMEMRGCPLIWPMVLAPLP